MKLSREEVLKIANLARLNLTDAEVEKYTKELSSILDYVEKLNTLDVSAIEPTAHAVFIPTPFRDDEMVADTTREGSLQNAPDREGDFFKVPRVIS
jgi:aspartyl-tRNA(Asn)/glutamyl-tRNA(Gln) amidotransferase subunit C